MSYFNDSFEAEIFKEESTDLRNEFVKQINRQAWNTKLRTAAESLLIMYDFMKDRMLNG